MGLIGLLMFENPERQLHQFAHGGAQGGHLGFPRASRRWYKAWMWGLWRVATTAVMDNAARIRGAPALESRGRRWRLLPDWHSTGTRSSPVGRAQDVPDILPNPLNPSDKTTLLPDLRFLPL